MVGRTPEWLGKKIEAREIKLAALGALFVPTMVLTLTALSIVTKSGLASVYNSGVHGFTETLYAYDSQSNNNGSAFAGFGLTNFSAYFGTIAILLGRFVPMLAALALGRLARGEEDGARLRGNVPDRRTDLRRPPRRRDRTDRRPDDLPGSHARADRGRTDALMRNILELSRRDRRDHRSVRLRLPAGHDGLRFGRDPASGGGQPDHGRRQGRRLSARGTGVHRARSTSTSGRRPRRPRTTPARRRSTTSARRTRTWRRRWPPRRRRS